MTTTESTAPAAEWIGVALTSVVTLRPSRGREHDLLGAHRLGAAERRGEREPVERDLAPVAAPAGQHPQQILRGAARRAQALHDALRLAVERHRLAGLRIEHSDADQRGLDQGLEVGTRALAMAP